MFPIKPQNEPRKLLHYPEFESVPTANFVCLVITWQYYRKHDVQNNMKKFVVSKRILIVGNYFGSNYS